ncbi:hypothetical protein GQ53DRAFT_619176, partial [Thozetella sp. PMI_491]
RLTLRELAMLRLMDALTDKLEWDRKIKDEDIVRRWKKEAMDSPDGLISGQTWDWVLTELRDRAPDFIAKKRILSFDNNSRVAKTDGLIPESLGADLKRGVSPLLNSPQEQKDFHPGSNNQVLNLVHPSLFPLVYGRTEVLQEGGCVELSNIFASYGKPMPAPTHSAYEPPKKTRPSWRARPPDRNLYRPRRFQRPPCEAESCGEEHTTDVKITSYINNLHPERHRTLYHTIEKLISFAIPLWNDVLMNDTEGRPRRIDTYYPDEGPEEPDWPRGEDAKRFGPDDARYPKLWAKVEEFLNLTEPEMDYDEEFDLEGEEDDDDENEEIRYAIIGKWLRIKYFVHPEPGKEQTYEEWEKKRRPSDLVPIYLQDTFRSKGLQVIVKLASIELTPEKPAYEGGNWHLEGMLNEHIVATAIYYFDISNVTDSALSFRQKAAMDLEDRVDEDGLERGLNLIYGTENLRYDKAVQVLGSVKTLDGRMLVFPNTLQHRVSPFELKDPTRPGHRRFIVLWLVDPVYRICSTRNVPPQRHDWWSEKAYDKIDVRFPIEVSTIISKEVGEYPMGNQEAQELRIDLMAERTRMTEVAKDDFDTYNLCEH